MNIEDIREEGFEVRGVVAEGPDFLPAGTPLPEVARLLGLKVVGLERTVDELKKLVQDLLESRITCLGCAIEFHKGARSAMNVANIVNGGGAYCFEHTQFVAGPAMPGRSAEGLILPGSGN